MDIIKRLSLELETKVTNAQSSLKKNCSSWASNLERKTLSSKEQPVNFVDKKQPISNETKNQLKRRLSLDASFGRRKSSNLLSASSNIDFLDFTHEDYDPDSSGALTNVTVKEYLQPGDFEKTKDGDFICFQGDEDFVVLNDGWVTLKSEMKQPQRHSLKQVIVDKIMSR